MPDKEREYWPEGTTASKALAMLVVPQLVLVAIALSAPAFDGVWPLERLEYSVGAIFLGTLLALGLIVAIDFGRRLFPGIAADIDRQAVRLFAEAPFKLTWTMVVLLSLMAGVFEEIVFRGALQGSLAASMPLWQAILIQSAAFAVLHPVSRAYMAVVFLIGIVLGLAYAASGNLLVPILAHVLYDIYAIGRLKLLAKDRADGVAPLG